MAEKIDGTPTITPRYRYALKARIIATGYENMSKFAEAMDVKLSRVSNVIRGWKIPGPQLQRKMAETLGTSLRELRGLLE